MNTPRGARDARTALLTLVLLLAIGACATDSRATSRVPSGDALNAAAERLILVTIANHDAQMPTEPGSTPHGYQGLGRYAVSDRARALSAALARDYGLQEVREWPIAPLKVQCLVFALPPQADRVALLRRLGADRRVQLAQPLQLFSVRAAPPAAVAAVASAPPVQAVAHAADSFYNDPYFDLQHGFSAINAAAAQRWSRGEGVRVAIIDTGVDVDHPDLVGRIAATRNFVNNDAKGFASDRHGTQVAGIIAAVANNGVGIVGVAPAARLLIYKACQPLQTQSLEAQCNSFTLALALDAAIAAHAQIVNLSLGGPADPLLAQLLDYGQRRGMVFVGAVPEGGQLDGFPLATQGVIAVDESGRSGGVAAVLHAPGREILSLAPGGRYDFASGSSFAAAHVSGALALLRARAPQADARSLFEALQRTSTHGEEGDMIDVCAALRPVAPRENCRRSLAVAAAGAE